MTTLTKNNIQQKFNSLWPKIKVILSNGQEWAGYRATIRAYIERGYYKGVEDKIEWAKVV